MARMRFRLRSKFTLLLALFSSLMLTGASVLLEFDMRQALVRESIDKGLGVARGIALNVEDPLLTGDDIALFSAVANAVRAPGIEYALIVDEQGMIKAADQVERSGDGYRPVSGEIVVEGESYKVTRPAGAERAVLDLQVTITTLAENPLPLGEIHLGLSEEVIHRAIAAMRWRMAAVALVAAAVGGLLAFFLASFVVQPIQALVQGVRGIGAGNLEQRIELRRNDELGELTTAFNDMADSLREKEYIRSTFERYVSRPLAKRILAQRDELQLGGEEREVTILFSDIRRFTNMAEGMPPARVVALLNEYFSRMIGIITAHEGMVDKFMGDAVMALFGAPVHLGDEALRSVRCALEMQAALREINQAREAAGEPPFAVGIGINTGPVVAGNIGSQDRMEYTVIGDNVNIAARLQGIAKAGEILVSESTYRAIRERVVATALAPVALKGKSSPLPVYRIDGLCEDGVKKARPALSGGRSESLFPDEVT